MSSRKNIVDLQYLIIIRELESQDYPSKVDFWYETRSFIHCLMRFFFLTTHAMLQWSNADGATEN